MLNRIAFVGVVAIVIAAIIHIVQTVTSHKTMLTALPLSIRLAVVIVFWAIVLVIGGVIYTVIVKHLLK